MDIHMDKDIKRALLGSIRKWDGIIAGVIEDRGMENCALCERFSNPSNLDACCKGCPVKKKTKRHSCEGTPYVKWRRSLQQAIFDRRLQFGCPARPDSPPPPIERKEHPVTLEQKFVRYNHTPEMLAAATAERDFLLSLMPKFTAEDLDLMPPGTRIKTNDQGTLPYYEWRNREGTVLRNGRYPGIVAGLLVEFSASETAFIWPSEVGRIF